MIKFFRKIRQKLISENKFSKYLIYAIGEIILVVIGILIALSINNWNENIKNNKLESLFITRLIDDINEEISFIDNYIHYNKQVKDFTNRVQQHFFNPVLALKMPNQSLIDFYQASQDIDARQPASTYKELNNSGQINLISNYELRTRLINFYESNWSNSNTANYSSSYREYLRRRMPNNIQEEIRINCGDIVIETGNSLSVKLQENCQIDIDEKEAKIVLTNLLKDSELKNNLNYLAGNMYSELTMVNSIQRRLIELKKELEQHK